MVKDNEVLTVGKKATKNKYGQYFTPNIVADFMIDLANIDENSTILEPCCGEGIFIEQLNNKGFKKVRAYEIDNTLARQFNCVQYESFITATIQEKYDLIIGNPPYIRWKNLEPELKEELTQNPLWNQHFNKLCDYLYIFILKSIKLLKEGGQLIFICPEYWMNTTHSISLRNYMAKHGYFEKIYHFNETPIFDKATVSVIIFKYIKSKKKVNKAIELVKYYKSKALTQEILNQLKGNNTPDTDIAHSIKRFKIPQFKIDKRWLLTNQVEIQLIEQFEQSCRDKKQKQYNTIGGVCDIGNGMVSGLDKGFQIPEQALSPKEQAKTIQVIKARELRSYTFEKTIPYIFVNSIETEKELIASYPTFYKKLADIKPKLEQRYQYNRKIPYWHWVFLRNYTLFSSKKARIFVPCKERISNKDYFRFAYVESEIFPTQDVTAIFLKEGVKESIFYLLAFLNNHRVFNWLKNKGIVKGSIVEFSEKPISSIPFKKIDWNNKYETKLHNQITKSTKDYLKTQNAGLLDKINDLFDSLLQN